MNKRKLTRRWFLKTASAGTIAAAASGYGTMSAYAAATERTGKQPGKRGKPMIIDAHAHIYAEPKIKPNPEATTYMSVEQQLEVMERMGIDMAVPLSPDELKRKRLAIFKHESQKDRAMFPGPYDDREFWQRAEQRNMATAEIYNGLGLPEYHAIEPFARWPVPRSLQAASQLSKGDG